MATTLSAVIVQLTNVDKGKVLWQGPAPSVKAGIETAVAMNMDLKGLDVCGQDLSGLNCGCGKFDDGEFKGASLNGANLAGSKFRNATLAGADLRGANLGGCDMTGANLDGILVDENTNFRGTKWGEQSRD